MASGRVGGTRALVSGKVGNEVYQIQQDSKGKYMQTVQAYSPHAAVNVSARLACQQMITAVVERLMKDLKEVAKISIQSAKNKSKSINAVSSFNLSRMLQDAKQNWYNEGRFVYPRKGDPLNAGGLFLVSSGTMSYNCFAEYVNTVYDDYNRSRFVFGNRTGSYLAFRIPYAGCTIREFMMANRLTYASTIVHVNLMRNQDTHRDSFYCYSIIKLSSKAKPTDLANAETLDRLFTVKANRFADRYYYDPSIVHPQWPDRAYLAYLIGNAEVAQISNYDPIYMAGFSKDYVNGRLLTSSATLANCIGGSGLWDIGGYPANQVGSWMNPSTQDPIDYPW